MVPSGDLRIVSVFAEPEVARSYGHLATDPGRWSNIPLLPILPVVCRASIFFVLSRPGCMKRLWKSQGKKLDVKIYDGFGQTYRE